MSANYADVTQLAIDLQRAAGRAEPSVQEILEHAGTQIQANAISGVAVKTGRLRNSIRMWVQPLKVTIGPDPARASYGAYLEYGTGTRGEFPTGMYEIRPKNHQYLKFNVGGKTVYTKLVRHPGISPHPYMRPALTNWVDSLGDDAAKVGVELIVGPNA